jgi:hypothetical protein
MSIRAGDGVQGNEAARWGWHLARHLRDDEIPTYLCAAHPAVTFEFIAVTNQRVVVGSTEKPTFEFEIELRDGVAAYAGEDAHGPCIHIAMADGDMCILRPRPTEEAATELGDVLSTALAEASLAQQGPIRPHELEGKAFFAGTGFDYLSIVVARDHVEAGNIQPYIGLLAPLLESAEAAEVFFERVAVSIDGYNETHWELFEIPEVRDFIQALDRRFPYWLHFLDKTTSAFDFIWRCFMPPFLTPAAMAEDHPARLIDLLERRWLPAATAVADFIDMSTRDRKALSERVALYLQGHRSFEVASRGGAGPVDPGPGEGSLTEERAAIMPASISLITGNGMFRIYDGRPEDPAVWPDEHDDIVAELDDIAMLGQIISWASEGAIPAEPSVDDPSVRRPVYLYVEDHDTLLVPFTLDPQTATDFVDVSVHGGARLNADEEWFRLDKQIECYFRGALERGERLLLQSPRNGQVVRLERRDLPKGGAALFVTSALPVGHDAWHSASEVGTGYSLAAPQTDENVHAASMLALLALRSAGAHPVDVFPSFEASAEG